MPRRDSDWYDELVLMLIVGDASVGKSQLMHRFERDVFCDDEKTTIGFNFATRMIDVDAERLMLQMWDIGGQERFRPLARGCFRGGRPTMLVYDVTNKSSFDNIQNWLVEIGQRHCEHILLIGNKSDLTAERVIGYEQGQAFANLHGMDFIETSAKTAHNVKEAFMIIARHATGRRESFETSSHSHSTIKLRRNKEEQARKKRCCCWYVTSLFRCSYFE